MLLTGVLLGQGALRSFGFNEEVGKIFGKTGGKAVCVTNFGQ
jgi:hypothetical protein